jgi:hypothetical protein
VTGRLDQSQLDELRRFAERLRSDERADVRAAARAIELLADELAELRGASRAMNDVWGALAERLNREGV